MPLARRDLLVRGGLLAGALWTMPGVALANAPGPPRVAGLGWACAQTLLALGVVPVAVPEIDRYRRLAVEPAIPQGVQEAGLRSEPNLELLEQLAPDLIVIDPSLTMAKSRLGRIAPVETFLVFTPGKRPTDQARESTRALASRIGLEAGCEAYLARVDDDMARARAQVGGYRGGPVYIISEVFANRALVFGRNSIYQDVLDRFGLPNAWTGDTSLWGHATVGLDAFSAPDARLLFLGSQLANLQAVLAARPLWRTLPFMREGRVTALSEILFYGGVPSADRFARLLGEKLPKGGA